MFELTKKLDFNENIGSSETIREVSFNFDLFIKNSVLHKKNFKLSDLEWLVGFTEGDGSFIVSKNRNFFMITQKSCKVLHKVKQLLGFGSVTKAGPYFRYIVANNSDTFRLICLFNGNLLLNKTNTRFQAWLNNYNQLNNTMISYIPFGSSLKESLFINSGWFSGFIDSEGCFYALVRKDRLLSLRLSLFVDQKDEKDILELIANDFNGYVVQRSMTQDKITSELDPAKYYRVVLSSQLSRQKLITYLSQYGLLGDKKISYLRWKRLHDLVVSPKAQASLNELNSDKLRKLCKNINKRDLSKSV